MAKGSSKIPKIIGICGNAGVGKNTMLECLDRYFIEARLGLCKYFSLGDICREEADPYCKEQFGISAYTKDREEKNLIRPIIVETVKIKKKQNPNYYVNKIKAPIQAAIKSKYIPIFPDIRYPEEFNFLKKKKAIFIFIDRDGCPPANNEELTHNEYLKANSDYNVKIPTFQNPADVYDYCTLFFKSWFQ